MLLIDLRMCLMQFVLHPWIVLLSWAMRGFNTSGNCPMLIVSMVV